MSNSKWLKSPEGQAHQKRMTAERAASPEWRKGASERAKKQWAEKRQAMLETQNRGRATPEYRAKRSENTKKQFSDPDFKKRFKAIQKAVFEDPEKRANRVAHLAEASRKASLTHPTSIELAVQEVLLALEEPFETEVQIGPYRVDIFLPRLNVVIECDGDYWHSLTETVRKDSQESGYLSDHGYDLVRLSESAIRSDPLAAVLSEFDSD